MFQSGGDELLMALVCYHCGLDCGTRGERHFDGKLFCCHGCEVAYQILSGAGLTDYYKLNNAPGISQKTSRHHGSYTELDDERITCQVCDFQDDRFADVTFGVPQIHCTSCVWLLENLYQLLPGIRRNQVNVFTKTVSIGFERGKVKLSQIAQTLDKLGYAPIIRDPKEVVTTIKTEKRNLTIKIGVAGFCFGNTMLLSFPEYLLGHGESLGEFNQLFAYLTFLFSLPVFLYSASDYFRSAITALKMRTLNIDVPLALGLFSLFVRSLYDIFILHHIGYMDSFTGLVFFLLCGRFFKEKTFEALNFERSYKAYFPLSLTRLVEDREELVPFSEVRTGDHLRLRNQEIVPADAVLRGGDANIDYSFVTGEAFPQQVKTGAMIYAGGRQRGGSIEVEIVKDVSQSHLTRLWNHAIFKEAKKRRFTELSSQVGQWFTAGTVIIAVIAGVYWRFNDPTRIIPATTSVLLIACPCALALAFPFVFGTAMRLLGQHGIYLKNMNVLETLSWITDIVFDKTGTITLQDNAKITFVPAKNKSALSTDEQTWIRSAVAHSAHPLSVSLFQQLPKTEPRPVSTFIEKPGSGLEATIDQHSIKIGSFKFITGESAETTNHHVVAVAINHEFRGYFFISQVLRTHVDTVMKLLSQNYALHLISGDQNNDQQTIALDAFSGRAQTIRYQQTPEDKLVFITNLATQNRHVAMVGDGLNDAGALRASDVGIAVTDDINAFSPASDVILSGASFDKLPSFFAAARSCMRILKATIALSLVYNTVGLGFAVTGLLSPFVSAVLMPISTISVMLFSSQLTRWRLTQLGLGGKNVSTLHHYAGEFYRRNWFCTRFLLGSKKRTV